MTNPMPANPPWWQRLSPRQQRAMVIVGVLTVLVLFIWLTTTPTDDTTNASRIPPVEHIFTDTDTRELGIDNLAAKLSTVSEQHATLQRQLTQLQSEMTQRRRQPSAGDTGWQSELQKLRDELVHTERLTGPTSPASTATTPARFHVPIESMNVPVGTNEQPLTHNAVFTTPATSHHANGAQQAHGSSPTQHAPLTIRSLGNPTEEIPIAHPPAAPIVYLPAGSLLQGTLITGVDAPTHDAARREPIPVLLRINAEAILPNFHHADIRECFLLMAGYGDLSAERAYLRGETLACMNTDGDTIETALDAYSVGEDGKAGIRGRLVSKQGQLVAKSMMAGFFEGMAGAFDVNPIPSIQTGNTNTQQAYQQVLSSQALQGAAIKGTSKALDRIAQFYLNMAENLFPVIEIDASRQIDIVVTRGTALHPNPSPVTTTTPAAQHTTTHSTTKGRKS